MSAHNPIGSCCSRPRFNAAGGIDDCAWKWTPSDNSLVKAALGVVYAYGFQSGLLRAIHRRIFKVTP